MTVVGVWVPESGATMIRMITMLTWKLQTAVPTPSLPLVMSRTALVMLMSCTIMQMSHGWMMRMSIFITEARVTSHQNRPNRQSNTRIPLVTMRSSARNTAHSMSILQRGLRSLKVPINQKSIMTAHRQRALCLTSTWRWILRKSWPIRWRTEDWP